MQKRNATCFDRADLKNGKLPGYPYPGTPGYAGSWLIINLLQMGSKTVTNPCQAPVRYQQAGTAFESENELHVDSFNSPT
eukprot:1077507-Rhodomonas_salina.1